jgi:transposase
MDDLALHYRLLLGLDENWGVSDVRVGEGRIEIVLVGSGEFECCGCGKVCPLRDHAKRRSWRHLDVMQYETVLTARVPRTDCPDCGVKTCVVPWAGKHTRFTLLFEEYSVRVLLAASSVEAARSLLGLEWATLNQIMVRAVGRGLARRDLDGVSYVGVDEKSFGKGQDYVTVLTDVDSKRVLEVVQGRDQGSADGLWDVFTETQKQGVKAASIDMWQAFENSVKQNLVNADIVHDKFHIMKYLNEAVDKTRRVEHKKLLNEGDDTLTRSKYLWLYNPENLDKDKKRKFRELKNSGLRTARAWAIKELFRQFWNYTYTANATKFFVRWYAWAIRSRLEPIKKVARMIKTRLPHILTWFKHRITNGPAEGYNSKIQNLKTSARGFTNFNNYRTRILFHCGKLNLTP